MKSYGKTLVYAEDLLWEIMQYPGSTMSKGMIKHCARLAMEQVEVNVFVHIWNTLKRRLGW